jgi:hypothetical protein
MAVIEVDCINGLPICIKTCGFYSIILGKIEAKFNCQQSLNLDSK